MTAVSRVSATEPPGMAVDVAVYAQGIALPCTNLIEASRSEEEAEHLETAAVVQNAIPEEPSVAE